MSPHKTSAVHLQVTTRRQVPLELTKSQHMPSKDTSANHIQAEVAESLFI